MTEEERQKLCEKLRDHNIFAFGWKERELVADEIERLAQELNEEKQKPKLRIRTAALAQSDVEPQDMREALADMREALADKRALEIRLAEQKKFNELLAEELKQTNRRLKADRSEE